MLPTIQLPTHIAKYQVKGFEKISFTPWNNSIQQNILLAKDNEDIDVRLQSYYDALNFCIKNDDIDVEQLPFFILFDLLIKIKAVSSGEMINLSTPCMADDCGKDIPFEFNLNTYTIVNQEDHTNSFTIDDIGFTLRYPTISEVTKLKGDDLLVELLDSCYENDTVYNVHSETIEERKRFIKSLPPTTIEEIQQKFIEKMPMVYKDIDMVCPHCKEKQSRQMRNAIKFFI